MPGQYQFNLLELVRQVWPGIPLRRLEGISKVDGSKPFSSLEARTTKSGETSLLGTPLFMPCKIDDFQMPNEPLIEINGSKNIVKTPVDGNKGTFKEMFALNDYAIVIRGIAVQEDGTDNYPDEQIRRIRTLCEKESQSRIVCDLLSYFEINSIVIESYSIPAIEGAQMFQPYQLNCLSDKVFDLELKNG